MSLPASALPTLHLFTPPPPSIPSPSTSAIQIAAYLKLILLTTSPLTAAPPKVLLRHHLVTQTPKPAQPPTPTPAPTPILEITQPDGSTTYITQLPAMLEYISEIEYPGTERSLLPRPASLVQRARVRELVALLTTFSYPFPPNTPTSSTFCEEMVRESMRARLLAYEALLPFPSLSTSTSTTYSVGSDVTLADVCLVPFIISAESWGVNLRNQEGKEEERFKKILAVYERCMAMVEFRVGCAVKKDDSGSGNTRMDRFPWENDVESDDEEEEEEDEDEEDNEAEEEYAGTIMAFEE
ncbi:hypothetical protein BDV96DRAFT_645767 [Lophiotrema nucula]|uniref:GST C-terminal domain-containing protein n=1 Tax=Lophiotrema nucula TaxID=690887 RepID=A0A6A5ZAA1_9PLEO|nr:hypothetical protein BDV96DRAFT_645767 [Lophiotrema nucula]